VNRDHQRERAEQKPGHVEVPLPRVDQRLGERHTGSGRGVRVRRARRRCLAYARQPHGQGREHRDDAAGAAEQRVGRAPADLRDEPRRQGSGRDVAEIEAHQDEGQRQTPALVEPAGDGGCREQIEARHADPAEDSDEEIELPQRADRRDQREGRAREDHGDDKHHARAMTIGERADAKSGDAAEQQIQGQRGGDSPPAPRERLGEDGQKHAVGRERGRDSVSDREQRGYDQPAARGRAHLRLLSQVPGAVSSAAESSG